MPIRSTRQPTQLGFTILGLLSKAKLSGHEVRMWFEHTPLKHYSSSPGSIYPALRQLERLGLIEKIPRTGKAAVNKKVYSLTRKGKSGLVGWLRAPGLPPETLVEDRDSVPLRFGYMEGMLSEPECLAYMETVHEGLKRAIANLEDYIEKSEPEMSRHGRMCLQLGLSVNYTWLDWASTTIESLGGAAPSENGNDK